MKNRLIIFDLDGTLLDTLEDIAYSANKVLQELGYKTYEVNEYRKFVGDGAKELMRNALEETSNEELVEKAFLMFKSLYGGKIHDKTKPYEGIYGMLDGLSELHDFSILSNKPHLLTIESIEYFFKEYEFQQIHGQKEDVPRKPNPTGAFNILNAIDKEYEKVFYIGDTATDMKTAVAANLIPIGILWGYQDEKSLSSHGAQYLANTPKELCEIIQNFVR